MERKKIIDRHPTLRGFDEFLKRIKIETGNTANKTMAASTKIKRGLSDGEEGEREHAS